MRQSKRIGIKAHQLALRSSWVTWGCAAVLVGAFAFSPQVAAQTPSAKGKAAAAKETGSPETTITAAASLIDGGKADAAVQQLSQVISSGKLPTTQMARALYYRGLAYRKQTKPAEAIADFTSALWIKNGLDANLRNDALMQRAGAYREAGLTDQAEADEKRVAASGRGGSSGSARTASAEAAAPSDSGASQSSSGFGNFFGSLFGGGSSPSTEQAEAQPAAQNTGSWTTSSTHTVPASGSMTKGTAGKTSSPALSSWSTQAVAATPAPSTTRVARAEPAAPAPVVRAAAKETGHYLQIAAVRSLKEAQAILAQVERIKADDRKGRDADIDQTVMGNMGTLYRVRLGPYADASDMRSVCARVRGAGLDCLIVSQ
jgi:cell division protein FtsN